jgi:hypothetical protein
MFIKEFYAKFTSGKESDHLFDALRRMSGLETRTLLSSCPGRGWPEWPSVLLESPEPEKI